MIATLITHSWKKFTRSVSFSKDVATLIFTAIMGILMLIYAIGLGFSLELILIKGLKLSDPSGFLNSILLYYFGFEFIMRYMMQNLPVLDIQPYLHLPVKKSVIVRYLLGRSVLHIMNVLVLFLFAPFAFGFIQEQYSSAAAIRWLASIWMISLFLHFLIVIFKKQLDDNLWGIIGLTIVFSFFGAAEYFHWFKLSAVSASVFGSAMTDFYLPGAALLATLILYYVNFNHFLKSIYPEEISTKQRSTFDNRKDFSFLRNFGPVGELINVEAKLILRNKRPRNILFLSAFLLLYGLIFYGEDKYSENFSGIFLFVGIFVTGIFMINYGQLLFSWQGSHFDFTLTRPLSARNYIESKYWLLSGVTIICFILTVPYVYFGWKILLVNLAMTLFNIGVNVFIILNIAMWAPKKVDLKKGATFNYEGIGAAQWIMGVPILISPYVIYVPFSLAGYPDLGVVAIGVTGLLGIILRNKLLELTKQRFMSLRYSIAGAFRKD